MEQFYDHSVQKREHKVSPSSPSPAVVDAETLGGAQMLELTEDWNKLCSNGNREMNCMNMPILRHYVSKINN